MAVKTIAYFNAKFITGYVITQDDYVDLCDTLTNQAVIMLANAGILTSPDGKSTVSIVNGHVEVKYNDGAGTITKCKFDGVNCEISSTDGTDGGAFGSNYNVASVSHSQKILFIAPSMQWFNKEGLGLLNMYLDNDGVFQTEVKPKTYKALLSQAGTADPTITSTDSSGNPNPFINTVGAILWTRVDDGHGGSYFNGFCTGAFPAGKTFLSPINIVGGLCGLTRIDDDNIITDSIGDDVLNYSSVNIEIYP